MRIENCEKCIFMACHHNIESGATLQGLTPRTLSSLRFFTWPRAPEYVLSPPYPRHRLLGRGGGGGGVGGMGGAPQVTRPLGTTNPRA